MPYLIDGHNLIGQLSDISLDDPDDEALLVQKLIGFVARTKHKCTVIFDQGLPAGKSRMSTHGVRVLFASHRSNADNMIIDRIYKERNPKIWTVISSDNRVLDVARRQKMQTMRSSNFADLLNRPTSSMKPGLDVATNIHLSEDEVAEWLDIFTGDGK